MQDKASGSQHPSAKRRKTKGGEDDEVCFAVSEGSHAYAMDRHASSCMVATA